MFVPQVERRRGLAHNDGQVLETPVLSYMFRFPLIICINAVCIHNTRTLFFIYSSTFYTMSTRFSFILSLF